MFEKLLRMIIGGRTLKKIIKKVLLIPGVKRWLEGITELEDCDIGYFSLNGITAKR